MTPLRPRPRPGAPFRLGPEHADAYRALMLDAYRREPDAFTATVEERQDAPPSLWAARLEPGPEAQTLTFGIEDRGTLAAVASLRFHDRPKTRHKATLMAVYVAPRLRGRGAGSALLRAALSAARGRPGTTVVQLTVSATNGKAQRLYERHGFVEFGLEPLAMLLDGRYVAKRHMACDLRSAAAGTTTGGGVAPRKATLFIFAGLPGTGKTTLSRRLASKIRGIHLRIDTLEQGLRDLCGLRVEGEGYRLAYRIAADNLRLGVDVVADSCNPIELTREEWRRVATDLGHPFVDIEVTCSDRGEHRRRIESRGSSIPGLVLPNWHDVEQREYQPWSRDRIHIDTAGLSEDEAFGSLVKALETQREPFSLD